VNYYVVLGIAEDADRDTIRSAFRAMVRRYHPDAGAGASSDAFRRVVEAYETLNDPERRRMYDRALHRHAARSPQKREQFVEPLSNRITADPIVSTRIRTVDYRRPVNSLPMQIDMDEILDALVGCFELAFWSLNGRRGL
jgi:curved DNA-binding protein CbpA